MATILCRVVWADNYKNQKEDFFAGNMKYPAIHGAAHELLNFFNEGGFVYGFVENKGDRINLSSLGARSDASRINKATVIWCALEPATRRLRVVGWYDNAEIYGEAQKLRRSVRGDWSFQFKAKAQDAHLILTTNRYLEVPMKPSIKDKGFIGQRNWFFPEKSPHYSQFLEAFSNFKEGHVEVPRLKGEEQEAFQEGQRLVTEINILTRNPKLVAAAKKEYGFRCQVCNFSFKERYGDLGSGFIEVHHLLPLAERKKQRLSTVADVGVLCANCHRMVHRRSPALSLSALKKLLR